MQSRIGVFVLGRGDGVAARLACSAAVMCGALVPCRAASQECCGGVQQQSQSWQACSNATSRYSQEPLADRCAIVLQQCNNRLQANCTKSLSKPQKQFAILHAS